MTAYQGLRFGESERGEPLLESLLLPGLDVAGKGGADGDGGRVGQRGPAAVPERGNVSRGTVGYGDGGGNVRRTGAKAVAEAGGGKRWVRVWYRLLLQNRLGPGLSERRGSLRRLMRLSGYDDVGALGTRHGGGGRGLNDDGHRRGSEGKRHGRRSVGDREHW